MTDNIIEFGKSQQTKPELDYEAIRDSVLGEPNILNIEGSIRFVSTDYLNQDDEFLNKMDLLIRDILGRVLESDEHCTELHHTLLAMDDYYDKIAISELGDGKMPYITTSIDFNIDDDNTLTLYILQVGYSRFIRTIRLNNEILHAIPN